MVNAGQRFELNKNFMPILVYLNLVFNLYAWSVKINNNNFCNLHAVAQSEAYFYGVFLSFSLYTIFPARAPVLNSTQYIELVELNPDAVAGLGWSAGKQAGFQFVALAVTLVVAILGGVLTGKLPRVIQT